MRLAKYILFVSFFLMLIISCQKHDKMIPANKMAKIYASLFMVDQWTYYNKLAVDRDSISVYEPIFRKYGYNVNDFKYSLSEYLNDPNKLIKILDNSKKLLKIELKNVNKAINNKYKRDSILRRMRIDSVSFEVLTTESKQMLSRIYKTMTPLFNFDSLYFKTDTTYKGPEIIVDSYIRRPLYRNHRRYMGILKRWR